jgi:hypothetical protein
MQRIFWSATLTAMALSKPPSVVYNGIAYLAASRSGISVGSLGQYAGEYDIVENVTAT